MGERKEMREESEQRAERIEMSGGKTRGEMRERKEVRDDRGKTRERRERT